MTNELEQERQKLLERMNLIDGRLAQLTKPAVAQAARAAGRGLERDAAKRANGQTRERLGIERRELVAEKSRLTSRYAAVKAALREQAPTSAPTTVALLTEIRDLLKKIVDLAKPVDGRPEGKARARHTE